MHKIFGYLKYLACNLFPVAFNNGILFQENFYYILSYIDMLKYFFHRKFCAQYLWFLYSGTQNEFGCILVYGHQYFEVLLNGVQLYQK